MNALAMLAYYCPYTDFTYFCDDSYEGRLVETIIREEQRVGPRTSFRTGSLVDRIDALFNVQACSTCKKNTAVLKNLGNELSDYEKSAIPPILWQLSCLGSHFPELEMDLTASTKYISHITFITIGKLSRFLDQNPISHYRPFHVLWALAAVCFGREYLGEDPFVVQRPNTRILQLPTMGPKNTMLLAGNVTTPDVAMNVIFSEDTRWRGRFIN